MQTYYQTLIIISISQSFLLITPPSCGSKLQSRHMGCLHLQSSTLCMIFNLLNVHLHLQLSSASCIVHDLHFSFISLDLESIIWTTTSSYQGFLWLTLNHPMGFLWIPLNQLIISKVVAGLPLITSSRIFIGLPLTITRDFWITTNHYKMKILMI